jgi:hypothetical protein
MESLLAVLWRRFAGGRAVDEDEDEDETVIVSSVPVPGSAPDMSAVDLETREEALRRVVWRGGAA